MKRILLTLVVLTVLAIAVVGGVCGILRWAPVESRPFVGALVGAAGTIFAAWIAWIAMQQNIASQRQLAERKEAETLDVVRLRLQGPLGMLNGFWRAIDEALEHNNPRREVSH